MMTPQKIILLLHINVFLSILVIGAVNDENPENPWLKFQQTPKIEQPILEADERELMLKNSGLTFKRLIGGGVLPKVNQSSISTRKTEAKKSMADIYPAYIPVSKKPMTQSLSQISSSSISKFRSQASNKDDESLNFKINEFNSELEQNRTVPLIETGEKIYPTEKGEYMKFTRRLALSDNNLDSLDDGNQLTNFMMDYLILNIIGFHEFHAESTFAYILSEIGNTFIVKRYNVNKTSIVNRMKIKHKTLLIPLKDADNINWNLITADTSEKTFTYFNPFSSANINLQKSKYHMKNFLKFISNRNKFVDYVEKIDVVNWQTKVQDFEIHPQKDWFNSGIYVLMYVDYVIHNRKFTMYANMYRKHLRNIIQDDNFNKFMDEIM